MTIENAGKMHPFLIAGDFVYYFPQNKALNALLTKHKANRAPV